MVFATDPKGSDYKLRGSDFQAALDPISHPSSATDPISYAVLNVYYFCKAASEIGSAGADLVQRPRARSLRGEREKQKDLIQFSAK